MALGVGALLALWAGPVAAAEVLTIAVLPLGSGASALQAPVREAVAALPRERFRQLSEPLIARIPRPPRCPLACVIQAGQALRADYVLTVDVVAASGGLDGHLELIHTRSNRSLARGQAGAENGADLRPALGAAAASLLERLQPGFAIRQAPPAPSPAVPAASAPASTPGPLAGPAGPSVTQQAEIDRQRARARAADAETRYVELHLAARSDVVLGNGELFARYDQGLGGGVELGVELFGVDLWGEALIQGSGQYLFSLNLGFDLEFGQTVRFLVGAYTGPMFLLFPRQPVEPLVLGEGERAALRAANITDRTLDRLQASYNQAAEEEADLNRLAVGWNLARLRLAVEWYAAPFLALGVHATGAYHYLLSGEEVAADIKYSAIQDVRRDQGLTAEQAEILREAVGAEPVDVDQLGGYNLTAGVYLKLSL